MSKGKLVKKDENDEQEEAVFLPVKGLERLALLDRAEEALTEARNTRISLLGKSDFCENEGNAQCTQLRECVQFLYEKSRFTYAFFFAVINLFHNFHYITGPAHKDSLYSSMHLASLLKMQDKPQEALAMLEEALIVAEEKYTKM